MVIDTADRDTKGKLKCRNWRRSGEDRNDLRRRIGEAKTQVGAVVP